MDFVWFVVHQAKRYPLIRLEDETIKDITQPACDGKEQSKAGGKPDKKGEVEIAERTTPRG